MPRRRSAPRPTEGGDQAEGGPAGCTYSRTTGAAAPEPVTAPQRPVRAPLGADDLHASLVRVLASLALSGRKAMSR